MRTNPKGLHVERWRHVHGCGRFFNAVRDTVSDKILRIYKAGEPKPDLDRPRPEDSHERNVPYPQPAAASTAAGPSPSASTARR